MHNCLATRQARALLALVVNRAPGLSGCPSVVYASRCAPSRRGDDSSGSPAGRFRIRRPWRSGRNRNPAADSAPVSSLSNLRVPSANSTITSSRRHDRRPTTPPAACRAAPAMPGPGSARSWSAFPNRTAARPAPRSSIGPPLGVVAVPRTARGSQASMANAENRSESRS
jgi:hypothetical protein